MAHQTSHKGHKGTPWIIFLLYPFVNLCDLRVRPSGRGWFRRDPFRVPIEVALVAIDDVARLFQSMVLAGINHQLSRDALAAQRLIHLLAIEEWHVEIGFAAEEKRGRFDFVGLQERI